MTAEFASIKGSGAAVIRAGQGLDLASLGTCKDFIIQGDVVGGLAGRSVSSSGDVNGDGFDDLTYVLCCSTFGGPLARR